MNITFEQYIQNPMGKNSMVLTATAREAIRTSYKNKYDAILLRERGHIEYKLYYDKKGNKFYAHIKVPSEVVPKFYYDTVIEFYTDEDIKNTQDLFKYYVRFFSNDPAFVYTYANAFTKNGLFIEALRSKMAKKAIKLEAKERNPHSEIGYVKSIYFAYLTMQHKGFNNVERFKAEASNFNKIILLNSVENADKKIQERQDEGSKITKQKSAAKKQEKKEEEKKSNAIKNTKRVGTIKQSTGFGSSKRIGQTKKVKRK